MVIADHTKLRLIGLSMIVPLDEIDVLVSDARMAEDDQAMLRSHVGQLLVPPKQEHNLWVMGVIR